MRSSEAAQKMAAARFSIACFCCCSLQCCVHSPVQLCLLETVDTCSAIHCCIRSTACCVGSCLQRACKHGMYAYTAVPRPTDTSYALCAHGTRLVSQASCSRDGKHSAGSQKNICQAISRPSSTACDEGGVSACVHNMPLALAGRIGALLSSSNSCLPLKMCSPDCVCLCIPAADSTHLAVCLLWITASIVGWIWLR